MKKLNCAIVIFILLTSSIYAKTRGQIITPDKLSSYDNNYNIKIEHIDKKIKVIISVSQKDIPNSDKPKLNEISCSISRWDKGELTLLKLEVKAQIKENHLVYSFFISPDLFKKSEVCISHVYKIMGKAEGEKEAHYVTMGGYQDIIKLKDFEQQNLGDNH